ncbi:anti-sigma factor [Gordonia sp. NPDC003585]|uniref:anti-sigma factor n=1 Tax=unclassified Gordonia (in: high G+C Gram-positive bacteria) TaxID=2657482 RepID=UPI0033B9BAFE
MSDDELLELAPVVGLNALSDDELREVEAQLADASPATRDEFARQVRATREAMASVSSVTATAPPSTLRDRILSSVTEGDETATSETSNVVSLPNRRRRIIYSAAAAVVAIAVGAVGWAIGYSMTDDDAPPPGPEQVFAAKDVQSSAGAVATGTATVYFSHSTDSGVLVMNSVPPPKPGTVYQMWLVGPEGARSAGTMTEKDVQPVTTAVIPNLQSATALAFTVEPPGGSASPTTPFVAQLPLS